MTNIIHIILAAGQSRRFGHEDKLLYKLQGKPLIEYTLDRYKYYNISPWIAVDVTNHSLINYLNSKSFDTIKIHHANNGMGHSIKESILYLSEQQNIPINAWMFSTADMPFIKKKTLQGMTRLYSQHECIIACRYLNTILPPIIFPDKYRQQLLSIDNNKGAKIVVQNNFNNARFIDLDKKESIDIDTKKVMQNID